MTGHLMLSTSVGAGLDGLLGTQASADRLWKKGRGGCVAHAAHTAAKSAGWVAYVLHNHQAPPPGPAGKGGTRVSPEAAELALQAVKLGMTAIVLVVIALILA
jgi:hypothetical protein